MRLADMDTCSVTDLRRNLSTRVEQVRTSGHPLLVTRRGTPVAVLVSIEQYVAAFGERDELTSFVRAAASATLTRIASEEVLVESDAEIDEDDYRRYLEEKYR